MAADESYPAELKYHPEHDWARVEGDTATLGITWYAQDALGEIVHFEPPEAGGTVATGESYGEVESVKAVSDLIAPLSGEIVEVTMTVANAAVRLIEWTSVSEAPGIRMTSGVMSQAKAGSPTQPRAIDASVMPSCVADR